MFQGYVVVLGALPARSSSAVRRWRSSREPSRACLAILANRPFLTTCR